MENSPQPVAQTSSAPFAISSSRVITPQGVVAASIVIENGKITQVIATVIERRMFRTALPTEN